MNKQNPEFSWEQHILNIINAFNEGRTIAYAPKIFETNLGTLTQEQYEKLYPEMVTTRHLIKAEVKSVEWDFVNSGYWIVLPETKRRFFQLAYLQGTDRMQLSVQRDSIKSVMARLDGYTRPIFILETLMVGIGLEMVVTNTNHSLDDYVIDHD